MVTWRQLEAVSDGVDGSNDVVRSIEMRPMKLAIDRKLERSTCMMTKTEAHPVLYRVLDLPMGLVVVALLHGLSLLQAVANVREELVALLHGLSHCRHPRTRLTHRNEWRAGSRDDLERRLLERSLQGGVADVLCG